MHNFPVNKTIMEMRCVYNADEEYLYYQNYIWKLFLGEFLYDDDREI